jgi:predicted RNA-binding protein
MRINTFGKSEASKTLDILLEDSPYKKTVGHFINKYREECDAILEISDKKIKSNLLEERKHSWLGEIQKKEWNKDIKTFSLNIISMIFRQHLKKIKLEK